MIHEVTIPESVRGVVTAAALEATDDNGNLDMFKMMDLFIAGQKWCVTEIQSATARRNNVSPDDNPAWLKSLDARVKRGDFDD